MCRSKQRRTITVSCPLNTAEHVWHVTEAIRALICGYRSGTNTIISAQKKKKSCFWYSSYLERLPQLCNNPNTETDALAERVVWLYFSERKCTGYIKNVVNVQQHLASLLGHALNEKPWTSVAWEFIIKLYAGVFHHYIYIYEDFRCKRL